MDGVNSKQEHWDALSIPFSKQIDAFLLPFPEQSQLKTLPLQQQLRSLSTLLKEPRYALSIARLFSPLLVDLCARWLDDEVQDEAKFIIFGVLLPAHEELYPVFSQFLRRPSLSNGPLGFVTQANATTIPRNQLHPILLAYHRLIEACPHLPNEFHWPTSPLQSLCNLSHPDTGVRLLAIRCFAIHAGMNEAARVQLEDKLVGKAGTIDAPVQTGFGEEIDIWILPLLDHKLFIDERENLRQVFSQCKGPQEMDPSLLSPRVAHIGGVLLLKGGIETKPLSGFVSTETTTRAIHQIALLLSLRQPILLSGPASSGKDTLLDYLFSTLNTSRHVVKIHLGDSSLDPRSLLGSYVSSTKSPGNFEWKDGVIVRAMKEGSFLVLENIDKASSEVLGTIWPLVESLSMAKPIGSHATLQVFGRERVIARDGFALFATRTTTHSSEVTQTSPTFLGWHKWRQVNLPGLSSKTINLILKQKYIHLGSRLIDAILRTWTRLAAIHNQQIGTTTRSLEMRDLIKWCSRLCAYSQNIHPGLMDEMELDPQQSEPLSAFILSPSLREDIFSDAYDVFLGSLNPNNDVSLFRIKTCVSVLANDLSISEDRLHYLINTKHPQLNIKKDQNGHISTVWIDRVGLTAVKRSESLSDATPLQSFALHRHSLSLLAALAGCIHNNEPVLLTGETGTGKTTAITYLASLLSQKLVSLNLSQQTESSDLLGGYKPSDARTSAQSTQNSFRNLFMRTFSREKNVKYEEATRIAVSGGKWKRAVALWREAARRAQDRIREKDEKLIDSPAAENQEVSRKRRKVDTAHGLRASLQDWIDFELSLNEFEARFLQGKARSIFEFVEGPLVAAVRQGHWVLLDEINLASSETLEAISIILQGSTDSIILAEQADTIPIIKHPNFRLFACMNPATDVGKKDLPAHLRSYFTELYVPPPDVDRDALLSIISKYIRHAAMADKQVIMDMAEFYTEARKMAERGEIADGSNQRPHYSMRTLARALTFAVDVSNAFVFRRALWEGSLMAFSTVLEPKSATMLQRLAFRHVFNGCKNVKSLLSQNPPCPPGAFVALGPFWLAQGSNQPLPVDHYILTPSVQAKLLDLARVILTRRFPILIEGPTSSGKTSAIEYLARLTGHRFVRINNHEHTDIQEYIGSYVADPSDGRLVFREGLLVRALRKGEWIVLDELNLAPSDVLEALNRLLDDNRELLIPETGEVIKPHPNFVLFATQNPSGLYAGRKVLSRAFRNRFLEVHFQDVPRQELEQIIEERCQIPKSYARRIVTVFHELQTRRQTDRVFETRHGFATLRDLFRWAGRSAGTVQELADNGYMIIAERSRKMEDKLVVKEVIEEVMKVHIDETALYDIRTSKLACPIPQDTSVIWTTSMQRLFVLLGRALQHSEPVLLVGDTGCGKTSVCELYAAACHLELQTINCHQNMETADLLGGQRPVRNRLALMHKKSQEISSLLASLSFFSELTESLPEAKLTEALAIARRPEDKAILREITQLMNRSIPLFEWSDGPLVSSMQSGSLFLLDEISLADDSVLERMNSVLEPSRTLVLAEKGGWDSDNLEITANDKFRLVATMNPGGDYGKKELSPALRNRFTEIWVPPIDNREDRLAIVQASWKHRDLRPYSEVVIDFAHWIGKAFEDDLTIGLRDLLAWVKFSDRMREHTELSPNEIFYHAAHMVVLDGLASLPQAQSWSVNSLIKFKERALVELTKLVSIDWDLPKDYPVVSSVDTFGVGPFKVALGNHSPPKLEFELQAPTTLENCKRVLRACQLNKPILLEGSPGVGKTSLIIALAALTSHNLCRVNLSDQTDLMDLFGSDLPVEGAEAGEFAWRDAAFLQAMQQGDWVLLDEMNLAPQAVLEGLNSVLDHRGTVFLPELDRTFTCHPDFRLFAAQNPVQQGGGRKGLPKSFVNRFTKVYLDDLNANDLLIIANRLYPDWSKHQLRQMITFNSKVHEETTVLKTMGRQGSPWEFNLRDVMRWLAMFQNPSLLEVSPLNPTEFLPEIYLERFRSSADRDRACLLVEDIFAEKMRKRCTHMDLSSQWTQFGHALIHQQPSWNQIPQPPIALQSHSIALESASKCIEKGWLIILVSNVGAGKTSLIRHLAARYGSRVIEFSTNSATDTSDILGSFEQEDTILCASTLIDQDFKLLDEDAISNLLETFGNLENTREATNSQERRDGKGRFTWVDGPLIRSIKEGSWFILDNANLCNPSVLDRLNSLCEMGGSLSLTERGLINGEVETIRPHPNFRLIMTMDPTNGELSRAMRNRGMEIYLEPSHSDEDQLQMNLFRRDYSPVHTPYKELIRLNHVPGYTSFGRMQPLLRLLPNFMAMELDAQVRFLLQITRQGNHAILRRLPHLGDVRNSLSAFLEIYDNLLTCQYEGFKETGLPPSFLYSQALEMRLNPNLVERAKHSRILTSIEWRSCCIYIAWRISHSSRRILNKTEQESILSVSEKFALNKAVMGQVPVEVQTIFPVITRCRTLLLELIQRPVPIADISTCSDFIELWEYANEVTQKSTLSYSLWLSVLKRMETIIQNYNNAEVNHAVSAALESLRLRSGLLMESIWSSHKPYFDGKLRSKWLIHAIEGSKETFPSTNAKVALRNQAIDLAALLVLTEGIQRISTEELLATKPLDPSTEVTTLSTLLFLKLLVGISQKGAEFNSYLENFCHVTSGITGFPTLLLVLTKAIICDINVVNVTDRIENAFHGWMDSVWNNFIEGAADLIKPTSLLSTLNLCLRGRKEIGSVAHYATHLRHALAAVVLESELEKSNRAEQLRCMFFGDMKTMFKIIGSTVLAPSYSENLARFTTNPNNDDFQWLAGHIDTEKDVGKETLRLSVAHLFDSSSSLDTMMALGTGWLFSGMIMVHLYVPNFPLDPQAVACSQYQRVETRIKDLEEELFLHRQMELLQSGSSDNPLISHLTRHIEKLRQDLSSSRPVSSEMREEATLRALSTELIQFHDQFVDLEHMSGLVAQLRNHDQRAAMTETMTQESWRSFIERIRENYPNFGDIVDPFITWVNRMRLGLSLLRHSVKSSSDIETRSSLFCEAITSFPRSVGARVLSHGVIQPPLYITPAEWASIRLYSSLLGIQRGDPLELHRICISRSFEQLFGCWLLERNKKEEEAKDKASIYRSRKEASTVLSDQETEAVEFLELFPEYGDVMEEKENRIQEPALSSKLVPPYQMFLQLPFFGSSSSRISDAIFQTTLMSAIGKMQEGLDTRLDEETVQFRLQFIHEAIQSLEMAPPSSQRYNFYLDSNVPQMIKALEVVSHLCDRLMQLVDRWPDHMVLQHLLERCQAIKKIDLHSSVAKMLSAIEQLLLVTEDWQKFADRENSILTHQNDLSNLIIEWRRMELVCWTHLLDNEAASFSNDLSDWWFRIYEITVHTTHQKMDTVTEETAFFEQLLPLVEGFLLSSPIGQYSSRIHLLAMFERYLTAIIRSPTTCTSFQRRLSIILGAVVASHQRFRPTVESTLKSRREIIDKEIKSFVQIASWKDNNVLTLKASAQRTHHQLHKSIRKFRRILAEPVTSLLSASIVDIPSPTVPPAHLLQIGPPDVVPELGRDIHLPRHLRNLDSTLRIFHVATCETSKPSFSLPSQQVEDFSSLILTTIIQFQNDTVPHGVKNKKGWHTNLLNRKRKALADLFKICKDHGLPSRIKPDIQDQQNSRVWILEHRPVITRSSGTLDKMDFYVDRSITSLPKLKMSLASHSEDISTRDLSKLLGFGQAALQSGFEARTQLYDSVIVYNRIICFLQSLQGAGMDCHVVASGAQARHFILEYISLASYSTSSAREIAQKAMDYPQYGAGAKSFDESIISDINQCIDSISSTQERLTKVLSRNSNSDILLFSHEEKEAKKLVESVEKLITTLKSWAENDPRAHHLCDAFIRSLADLLNKMPASSKPDDSVKTIVSEIPIESMLIIVQRLSTLELSSPLNAFIRDGAIQCKQFAAMWGLHHFWEEIQAFVSSLHLSNCSDALLRRMHPFLLRISRLLEEYIGCLETWAKSLFKLASVLLDLGQSLADRGFCQPSDEETTQKQGNEIDMEGTGVGEGIGQANVSSQIEDASQVEGMEGEEQAPNEKRGPDQEDTIEMEGDFGGKLEDVDENEEGTEGSDGEDDEVEEQMEKLDPMDRGAVDEKMWEGNGNNDEKNDQTSDQKVDQQHPKESETAAVEKKDNTSGKQDDEPSTNDPHEEEEDDVNSEGPDLEHEPNEAGMATESQAKEQEILDLPEDLDLTMDQPTSDMGEDVDNLDDGESLSEKGENDVTEELEGKDQDEAEGMPMESDTQLEEIAQEPNDNQSSVTKAADSSGQGQSNALGEEHVPTNRSNELQNTDDSQLERPEGNIGDGSRDVDERAQHGSGEQGSQTRQGEQTESTPYQAPNQTSKTLADAFTEVQRRYQEILDSFDRDSRQNTDETARDAAAVEHTQDDTPQTTTALGQANENEMMRLKDLNILDYPVPDPDEDVDMLNEPQTEPISHKQTEKLPPEYEEGFLQHKPEDSITTDQIRKSNHPQESPSFGSSAALPASSAEKPLTSGEVEERLISWKSSNGTNDSAESIWRLYSSLTHELAWVLCEQLRLILEPTKATRLRGDYRSGKRLNMKKIIPYIASEYTKDKIWLRRTKPSQREYQILLAMDDSKSMFESHSEHLAFQTLALVSKALTRLEAGDIAVAKFGKEVEVIHAFNDGPFNDTAGAKAIHRFSFDQNSTNVLKLVETSLAFLQDARNKRSSSSSSSTSALWQLQIIISDGICSDHDQLRATLRRAAAQKVMIVFIVVDSLTRANQSHQSSTAQNSILSMKHVKTDGTIERYLDIFPFEYYVVVRNVDLLPDVLSGTLKQFFERISEE